MQNPTQSHGGLSAGSSTAVWFPIRRRFNGLNVVSAY